MEYVYLREEGADGARLDKISAPSNDIGWDIAHERGPGGKLYVGMPFHEGSNTSQGDELKYIALGKGSAGGSQYGMISTGELAEAWRVAREKFGPSAWLGVEVPEPPPPVKRVRKKRQP